MPHSPPRPGAWALAAFLALGPGAFVPPGGAPGHAGQADGHLQGQIPNSPPFLAIPFPLTSDYRPLEGGLLVADLDADGRVELVVTVPSGIVTVIRADGSPAPGWPRNFNDMTPPAFPFGAPAVGDLDGDGTLEVVVCVVSTSAPRENSLYAIRADGSDLDSDPTDTRKPWPVKIQHGGADYYSCSPSGALVADLDGDGAMEVVRAMSRGEIVAFDGDGSPLDGWPVRLGTDDFGRLKEVNADLAAADLDGDGKEEVVFVEAGLAPRLAAVSGTGTLLPGFPIALSEEVTDRQAPVLVDLNRDGRPEIVQSTTLPSTDDLLSGSPESEPQPGEPPGHAALHVIVMRADGKPAPGWSRPLQSGGVWGAVMADLEGDTFPEIFQEDGDALLGFDAAGTLLPGFPLTIHRDFLRSHSLRVSPWVTGDVDCDAAPDFVQARSNIYNGSAYLRLMGLRATGQPLKGFPFDAEGRLAASRPVLADLSSDGTVDLALLTKDGPNGRWILVVWDLGALLRGAQAP